MKLTPNRDTRHNTSIWKVKQGAKLYRNPTGFDDLNAVNVVDGSSTLLGNDDYNANYDEAQCSTNQLNDLRHVVTASVGSYAIEERFTFVLPIFPAVRNFFSLHACSSAFYFQQRHTTVIRCL